MSSFLEALGRYLSAQLEFNHAVVNWMWCQFGLNICFFILIVYLLFWRFYGENKKDKSRP